MTIRPGYLIPLMMLLVLSAFPVAAYAQTREIAEVQQWQRYRGMHTLYAGYGHGSFAGPYTVSPGEPVLNLTREKARELITLSRYLEHHHVAMNGHVGFWLEPGPWTLLIGAPNGAIPGRLPFTVNERTIIEISAVFYDPRSDDFAVRLQSTYVGDGHHPRRRNDATNPIPGAALFVEASWQQLSSMVATAEYAVTSASYMQYSPNKNHNMKVAAEQINLAARSVSTIDANVFMRLNDWEFVRENYKPWYSLVNGRATEEPGTLAGGVCGMLSPAMNPLYRLLLDQGIPIDLDARPHSQGFQYNPTGSDPLLWGVYQGRYFVADTTVQYPAPNAILRVGQPVTMKIDLLYYSETKWQIFFIARASLG